MERTIKIPTDFEVQPIGPNDPAEDRVTCGTCGLSWDDGKVTSMTPAPAARCPFEAFRVAEEETMQRISNQEIDEAKRILRAAYYQDIKTTAEELKSECDKGEIADRDELETRIHEECDGSEWVIYTAKAWHLLFVSDNDEAYFETGMGREGALTDDGLDVSALAYHAMRRDLEEALEVAGIDSDWDGPEEEDEEEEDEEKAETAPPTDEERAAVARALADGAWLKAETIAERASLAWDRALSALMQLREEGLAHASFRYEEWAANVSKAQMEEALSAVGVTPTPLVAIQKESTFEASYVTRALAFLALLGRIQVLPGNYYQRTEAE